MCMQVLSGVIRRDINMQKISLTFSQRFSLVQSIIRNIVFEGSTLNNEDSQSNSGTCHCFCWGDRNGCGKTKCSSKINCKQQNV